MINKKNINGELLKILVGIYVYDAKKNLQIVSFLQESFFFFTRKNNLIIVNNNHVFFKNNIKLIKKELLKISNLKLNISNIANKKNFLDGFEIYNEKIFLTKEEIAINNNF